ncbi:MAG TPA: hypothetical protein VK053_16800 [Jiangellaceae bacterium]|nr:hypothetical protein [Jiangellaceae bacterium]
MSDRVVMTAPTGRGTAKVAKRRVEDFKANGWREAPAPKPAPKRRKKTDDADAE